MLLRTKDMVRALGVLASTMLLAAACSSSSSGGSTQSGKDAGGSNGEAGGGGDAQAHPACDAVGGVCQQVCAGTFTIASTTSCGDGEFCCVDNGGNTGDAGGDGSGGCVGTAPNCFGNDTSMCCGQDPAGTAQCVGGAWKCGSADAPGCNGTSCLAQQDAGSD
jgi:hypothetical protein